MHKDRIKNIKTIFFDFDGTIHNSIKIYAPAFRKAYEVLVKEGHAAEKSWKDEEISFWLGFSSVEMWQQFMPYLEKTVKEKVSKMIGKEMFRLLDEGKGVLYEGTLSTLKYLKNKGYNLIILSNCNSEYRDKAMKVFRLSKYFIEAICSQEYDYLEKKDILKIIMNKYPADMAIVGDRFHDIVAGKENHIVTIGCSYGFQRQGELVEADYLINDIEELKDIF